MKYILVIYNKYIYAIKDFDHPGGMEIIKSYNYHDITTIFDKYHIDSMMFNIDAQEYFYDNKIADKIGMIKLCSNPFAQDDRESKNIKSHWSNIVSLGEHIVPKYMSYGILIDDVLKSSLNDMIFLLTYEINNSRFKLSHKTKNQLYTLYIEEVGSKYCVNREYFIDDLHKYIMTTFVDNGYIIPIV
jgi:hypothetical protein